MVIGSGNMATDCIATAVRMGCSEVIQFIDHTELTGNAKSKDKVFQVEYGHEEAIVMQGREPREFGVK